MSYGRNMMLIKTSFYYLIFSQSLNVMNRHDFTMFLAFQETV